MLFNSVTGAVDLMKSIGKYELYFRDDEIIYAMARVGRGGRSRREEEHMY